MFYSDNQFKKIYFCNSNKMFVLNDNNWMLQNENINLKTISHQEVLKIYQNSSNKIILPISVVGAGNPNEEEYLVAYEFGKIMAEIGITVLCGGRSGVMEAVCKGVAQNHGIAIGMLPNLDIEDANKYLSIAIPTGIGLSRNTIIATAGFCMFSIGGTHGTLSEIAFALQYKKLVMSIYLPYNINGIINVANIDEVLVNICNHILFKNGTPK